ncbi:hypothetical protein D3C72_2405170 [compost metagenome]
MVHQKTDRVAVFAAAKAVVELLGGADAERGRFFTMERAQPHVIGTAFFQLYIAAHHIDDIDAGEQFLDE